VVPARGHLKLHRRRKGVLDRQARGEPHVAAFREIGHPQAAPKGPVRRGAVRVFQVRSGLQALQALVERLVAVERVAQLEGQSPGVQARLDRVGGPRHVFDVGLHRRVLHDVRLRKARAGELKDRRALVAGARDGEGREEPVGEEVRPLGAERAVAVAHVELLVVAGGDTKLVLSAVGCQ